MAQVARADARRRSVTGCVWTTLIVVGVVALVIVAASWPRMRTGLPRYLRRHFKDKAEFEAFATEARRSSPGSTSNAADVAARRSAVMFALYGRMGYGAVADALLAKARSCFWLVPTKQADKPLWSRIGGRPDLPDTVDWPTYQGRSLSFIAQVNLAELGGKAGAEPLPGAGMLYFFYDSAQSTWGFDPEDKGSWAVVYRDEDPHSTAIEFPEDVPDPARFNSVPVKLRPGATMPDPSVVLAKCDLSDDQDEEEVHEVYWRYSRHAASGHQLLGHADPIQCEMELECQLVSHGVYWGDGTPYNDPRARTLAAGASQWRLLLQIDSDDQAGMMWGDGGRLYFWITEDDLKNRRFENVWMILQCG